METEITQQSLFRKCRIRIELSTCYVLNIWWMKSSFWFSLEKREGLVKKPKHLSCQAGQKPELNGWHCASFCLGLHSMDVYLHESQAETFKQDFLHEIIFRSTLTGWDWPGIKCWKAWMVGNSQGLHVIHFTSEMFGYKATAAVLNRTSLGGTCLAFAMLEGGCHPVTTA